MASNAHRPIPPGPLPAPPEAPRKDGLDVLRALAILSVLGFHSPEFVRAVLPPALRFGFEHGWMGVDLFFVLSGYLIGRQVFGTQEENSLGAQLRTFWLKRWMRTLPLYFLVLALYALKPWVFGTPFVGGGWHYALFLQNYTGVLDFGQSWSLCVEEHFYLLLPLLAFGLRGRQWPAWVWLVPAAMSLLARAWLSRTIPEGLLPDQQLTRLQWPTHLHLDGLAVGVFLAKTAPTWRRWSARWRAACGVLGVVLLAITIAVCGPRILGMGSVFIFTGLALSFGGLLVGMESLQLPTALRWPVYQVAVLSYGAYLWFGLVLRIFERAHLSLGLWGLDLLAFLAATLALAWVTYHGVEKPGLRLRDRLLAHLAARTEARSGATALGG